ncbi:MAG: hypothetical protein SangKO_027830 [Sandaracinaceae bacterium]
MLRAGRMRVRSTLLALGFLTLGSLSAPAPASASDGYEVTLPIVGALFTTVGLDTTFIIATATGLTYEDAGWAAAQLTWAGASLAASAVGMGWAVEQGYDGLAGGVALQAVGSVVLGVYAILGLTEPHADSMPTATVALLPRAGGGELTLLGTFE